MPDERRVYLFSELCDVFVISLRKAYERAAEIFVDIVCLMLRGRLVNRNINAADFYIVNRADCVVELRQVGLVGVEIRLESDVYPDFVCIFLRRALISSMYLRVSAVVMQYDGSIDVCECPENPSAVKP